MIKPDYFSRSGDALLCGLCPHACRILPGHAGLCGVRSNVGGEPSLKYAGAVSARALDPVEKKPLFHFRPGESVFSLGFWGCNLSCPFCQNHEISQRLPAATEIFSPERVVAEAKRADTGMIAYTYSEPIIHAEFVKACAVAARKAGLANVLVTNGCANPEPWEDLVALMDAVNIDLKAANAETYRTTLGGDLAAVKRSIEYAARRTHLEVTTLVVPGMNDGVTEIDEIASFIASISPGIPFHLSAYRPAWKCVAPPTSPALVERLSSIAAKRLEYVYSGNVRGERNATRCPSCGEIVLERDGFRIARNETDMDGQAYRCRHCSAILPLKR